MRRFWLIFSFISSFSYAQHEIEHVLDNFHKAAGAADFTGYFALLANDSIFLGTDATERWDKASFKAFAKPHFDKGNGWLYQPTHRNITIIEANKIAMFDELLTNEFYGQCRGSGIIVKREGHWKILQYNLSIPVPNKLSNQVVSIINGSKNK
ncbi:nuclear transport factor 2 family protein [Thalassotalea sp. 1_MG-2023]|uniref:nuclear transport factor 2 family protein n=1 Tax=Thalassotalea sp. 1_MG-2023 TaxID=3062680 RepID=UPI0026E47236|nr:nuclear transport factor 2 family protein [Thalassotalea sp. 1_MG-2023]MDO6426163.1 nuclear transport factor 2 family protein [Thalassotalea sp. 1_MG-2023]